MIFIPDIDFSVRDADGHCAADLVRVQRLLKDADGAVRADIRIPEIGDGKNNRLEKKAVRGLGSRFRQDGKVEKIQAGKNRETKFCDVLDQDDPFEFFFRRQGCQGKLFVPSDIHGGVDKVVPGVRLGDKWLVRGYFIHATPSECTAASLFPCRPSR